MKVVSSRSLYSRQTVKRRSAKISRHPVSRNSELTNKETITGLQSRNEADANSNISGFKLPATDNLTLFDVLDQIKTIKLRKSEKDSGCNVCELHINNEKVESLDVPSMDDFKGVEGGIIIRWLCNVLNIDDQLIIDEHHSGHVERDSFSIHIARAFIAAFGYSIEFNCDLETGEDCVYDVKKKSGRDLFNDTVNFARQLYRTAYDHGVETGTERGGKEILGKINNLPGGDVVIQKYMKSENIEQLILG